MTTTTRLAPTAAPVLDFEVRMSSRRGAAHCLDYRVFEMRTGLDVTVGTAPTREEGVLRALGAISDRQPSRVFVVQVEGFWCARACGEWAPLPVNSRATPSFVLAYVNALPLTRGRAVEVCDVAALAASFIGH